MIADGLRGAALACAAVLLVADPNGLALAGILVTSVAGLIAQLIKNRDDAKREERKHRFDQEDRHETALVRASIDSRLAELGVKATAAYDVGARIAPSITNAADRANALGVEIRHDIAETTAIVREASTKIDAAAVLIQREAET